MFFFRCVPQNYVTKTDTFGVRTLYRMYILCFQYPYKYLYLVFKFSPLVIIFFMYVILSTVVSCAIILVFVLGWKFSGTSSSYTVFVIAATEPKLRTEAKTSAEVRCVIFRITVPNRSCASILLVLFIIICSILFFYILWVLHIVLLL